MFANEVLGTATFGLGAGGVGEPVFQGLGEFFGIVDDGGGVMGGEQFDGLGEVGGVRAEAARLSEGGDFDHVAAAEFDEGAADKDGEGECVEFSEFAHGVEEENLMIFEF